MPGLIPESAILDDDEQVLPLQAPVPLPGRGRRPLRRLRADVVAVAGLLLLAVFVVAGVVGPILEPHPAETIYLVDTNEYMVAGLAVHMNRPLAEKLLGVQGVDGYIIKAKTQYLDSLKPKRLFNL